MQKPLAEIKRTAIKDANALRSKLAISQLRPLCPFDISDGLDVDVRFIEGSSFEGMYIKSHGQILLPAERPYMRCVFACAHELGHWHYGHETRVDLTEEDVHLGEASEIEECQANIYGSYLLLPNRLLRKSIKDHKLNLNEPDPLVIYEMSCWAGVSYRLMVSRLRKFCRISHQVSNMTPRRLVKDIGIQDITGRVVLHIQSEPETMSLETGDHLIVPSGSVVDHNGLVKIGRVAMGDTYMATTPGVGLCENGNCWQAPIRVMNNGYTGLSTYRNLAP